MQNGIPWWYFQRHGGPLEGRCVRDVDPDGAIMSAIDPARIIGCVVYPARELVAPGVVRHIEGDRFPLGELDGTDDGARRARSPKRSTRAGLKAPVLDNIRAEIWLKLWGNLTFNPISALTHSTLVDICQYPAHARAGARDDGAKRRRSRTRSASTFRVTLEKRIAGAEKVGKHKTSMLQDVEAGREPEIDALVGSVIELGRLTGVPTPHIDAVYALVKLLGRTMQEERVSIRAQPFGCAASDLRGGSGLESRRGLQRRDRRRRTRGREPRRRARRRAGLVDRGRRAFPARAARRTTGTAASTQSARRRASSSSPLGPGRGSTRARVQPVGRHGDLRRRARRAARVLRLRDRRRGARAHRRERAARSTRCGRRLRD